MKTPHRLIIVYEVIYLNYGIYKGIRGASWQCLIDCNITSLPISVSQIMQHYNIDMIYDSNVGILLPHESGRIIVTDKQRIIIRDEQTRQRQRFTAMHELGHYLLGHLGETGELSRSQVKAPQEQEADMFAARVLMPACVLWAVDARTPQEIADLCNVSMQAAAYRAERLAVLRERNKFLTSPIERQVYQQCSGFIGKSNKKS